MTRLAILCIGILALILTGCSGGEKQPDSASKTDSTTSSKPAETKPATPPESVQPNPMFEQAKQIIVGQGCGSCHTLKSAGLDLNGNIGPDLTNEAVRNRTPEWIRQQLIDPTSIPNEQVAAGFEGQQIVMPSYGRILSSEELDLLVNFLMNLGKE